MLNRKNKRTRPRKNKTADAKSGFPKPFKCVLAAFPLTLLAGVLFLLPATAILLATGDPAAFSRPVATALSYLTAFVGGMIAAKLGKQKSPILHGGALGAVLTLFFFGVALLLPGGTSFGGWGHLARFLLFPVTLLGALFASRKKKRTRRMH